MVLKSEHGRLCPQPVVKGVAKAGRNKEHVALALQLCQVKLEVFTIDLNLDAHQEARFEQGELQTAGRRAARLLVAVVWIDLLETNAIQVHSRLLPQLEHIEPRAYIPRLEHRHLVAEQRHLESGAQADWAASKNGHL